MDAHITRERVRRYLSRLCDTPAPSTAASAFRTPVLKALLARGRRAGHGRACICARISRTPEARCLITGTPEAAAKKLWYFAHLDTISYLVQPRLGDAYPLVPFCYHLMKDGVCAARAYRFDLAAGRYVLVAGGRAPLEGRSTRRSVRGTRGVDILPGDRIVPFTPYREDPASGNFVGHMDNAGGVAALAVAAPVLAQAGVEALIALPDEEEGPPGAGNQIMGRGGSRIVSLLPPPDLAVIADVQQAGGDPDADTHDGVENSTRLGAGAVLAEFSSLARGAVTPPHLYALARQLPRHRGPGGRARAGVQQRLHLAQRRRQRAA